MNKIRRVAEDLVSRYPSLFSSDFNKNKQALIGVSVIRARSIRNQLAGAITRIVNERGPLQEKEKELTLGDQIMAEVEQETKSAEALTSASLEKPAPSGESKPQQETPAAQ